MRLFVALTVLLAMTAQMTLAAGLSFSDRMDLEYQGDAPVAAAIHLAPGEVDAVLQRLRPDQQLRLDDLQTLVVRAPSSRLLTIADDAAVRQIELLDPAMSNRVAGVLQALQTLSLQHGAMYRIGALNISLGVPKALLTQNRSGENVVRRALSQFASRHGVPVVMSIGNDGPVAGLVNPWGLADGVVLATATDADGSTYWPTSSRFRPGELGDRDLFAAHGYLSVGAFARGSRKTPAMLEDEKRVNLTQLVGAGNEALYRVDSGTSYAAAELTRTFCALHQAVGLLHGAMSATSPLRVEIPPFIRAYLDTGIDTSHPLFEKRLANRTPIYGGLTIEIARERRQNLHRLLLSGARLRFEYSRTSALAILKAAAKAVPGTTRDETGHGFISLGSLLSYLSQWRTADLGRFFLPADAASSRLRSLFETNDAPVFTTDEIAAIGEYCTRFDLILMHAIR